MPTSLATTIKNMDTIPNECNIELPVEKPDVYRHYRQSLKTSKHYEMEAYNLPWNHLKYSFYDDSRFLFVLALGNYISHMEKKEDLQTYLQDLIEVMQPGGVLIFDHRNFTKIENSPNSVDPIGDYIKNIKRNTFIAMIKS